MRLKLIFFSLLSSLCLADCTTGLSPTLTSRAGIPKPAITSCGWGTQTNENWDVIDASAALLGVSNTYTGANTFNAGLTVGGGQGAVFNDATTHSITLKAPSSVTSTSFNLPTGDGTSGQFMKTDGSGNLSFATAPGAASTLGVTTGTSSGIGGFVASSPTATIDFDGSAFRSSALSGSTVYMSLSPSSVTLQGNTFNQASKLVQLDSAGKLPAVDGSQLTNITYGTNYSKTFTSTTSVSLNHNAGTNSIEVQCYDAASPPNAIGYNTLQLTNTSTATVTFTNSQSGTCVVSSTGGGVDNLGNHIATKNINAGFGLTASSVTISTAATGYTIQISTNGIQFSSTAVMGIVGTTTNDNAPSGTYGQYISTSMAGQFMNVSSSNQYFDLISTGVSAGDWNCSGVVDITLNGATVTQNSGGISTTSGNSSTGLTMGDSLVEVPATTTLSDSSASIPDVRFSLNSATTLYLKGHVIFSAGTPKVTGRLSCRRMR